MQCSQRFCHFVKCVGWVGDASHVDFGKTFLGKKKKKRKCETANYFVVEVLGKIFAHFEPVAVKRHSSIWN
jgi:hypothetical protein